MADPPVTEMRIVMNAVAVKGGGSQTYLVGILGALCASEPAHEYWVVLGPDQRASLGPLPSRARAIVCSSMPRATWLRVVWEQTVLPVFLWRWRADLLFAAFNTAVLLSPVPVVLVAHSVTPYSKLPIRWPLYMVLHNAARLWLGRLSARIARAVVFVSETSAKVMTPRMGVPSARVRVIHHGWQPFPDGAHLEPALRLPPRARYILAVSELVEHKNLEVLVEAFRRLVEDGAYEGHLVIIGSAHPGSYGYARRLEKQRAKLSCRERVHFAGHLNYSALSAVYRKADLFVLPSLEETFGFPLVEAMGVGVPVIVADWRMAQGGEDGLTNVGPEICAEAAEFFDPTDITSLVDAMRRLLRDPARREELARAGHVRAHKFPWQKTAAALLSAFEEVSLER